MSSPTDYTPTDRGHRTVPVLAQHLTALHQRLTQRAAYRGVSIIEITVALALAALLIASVAPSVVVAIKANAKAELSASGKSLAAGELELMRNLAFNVSPVAGDYVDLFDRYFPNTRTPTTVISCTDPAGFAPAPAVSDTGYLAASATRCAWELPGPMYRRVQTAATNPALGDSVLVTNVQFITASSPATAVAPPSNYSITADSTDNPVTPQVRVLVAVFPTEVSVREPLISTTQITRSFEAATRLTASMNISALQAATTTSADELVLMDIGRLSSQASLTSAAVMKTLLTSVSAVNSTRSQTALGAQRQGAAPPTTAIGAANASQTSLSGSTCDRACWGATNILGYGVSASAGSPTAGSPTSPMGIRLSPGSSYPAFLFDAGQDNRYRNSLRLINGLVRSRSSDVVAGVSSACAAATTGTAVAASIDAWVRTVTPIPDDLSQANLDSALVETCGQARVGTFGVLATDFAPEGLLKVRLEYLNARCRVSGQSRTPNASLSYQATVTRWTPTGYVAMATLSDTDTTDPFDSVNLATTPVGIYGPLSTWFNDLSASTRGTRTVTATGAKAAIEMAGILTIETVPLQQNDGGSPDANSALNVNVGSVSCAVEDKR